MLASTAYHEAGHAVVAWRLGLKINAISIVPSSDGSLGRIYHSNPLRGIDLELNESMRARARAENAIMVFLAGPIAQRRFNPHGFRRYHASTDWEAAAKLLLRIAGESPKAARAYWTLLEEWTTGMVSSSWVEIETLAEAVLERQSLNASQIRRVIFDDAFDRRRACTRRRRSS